MRRTATSVAAVVVLVALLPALGAAGWRSADRPQRDDGVVEEPCPRDDLGNPAWRPGEPGGWQTGEPDGWRTGEPDGWQGDQYGRESRHRGDRRRGRVDSMPPQGSQPYWGTMRPYWNAPEPPGVIHRQPRTAPLKVPAK